MEIFKIGFLSIRLLDIIDILIVAFLLYKLYDLLKGGVAMNIVAGIVFIYFIWWLCVKVLDMQLLGTLLGQFIGVGVLALIIVFQQEVRRFLILLGASNPVSKGTVGKQWLPWNWQLRQNISINVPAIVKACGSMSRNLTGALIVIARSTDLRFYASTGDPVNSEVSKRLLESIFFKNSPLHDGAVIIENNRIKAARCVLPVTENTELPAYMGMRHRAALGISEQSDAISIIVSEETGHIGVAVNGDIRSNISPEQLEEMLVKELS